MTIWNIWNLSIYLLLSVSLCMNCMNFALSSEWFCLDICSKTDLVEARQHKCEALKCCPGSVLWKSVYDFSSANSQLSRFFRRCLSLALCWFSVYLCHVYLVHFLVAHDIHRSIFLSAWAPCLSMASHWPENIFLLVFALQVIILGQNLWHWKIQFHAW